MKFEIGDRVVVNVPECFLKVGTTEIRQCHKDVFEIIDIHKCGEYELLGIPAISFPSNWLILEERYKLMTEEETIKHILKTYFNKLDDAQRVEWLNELEHELLEDFPKDMDLEDLISYYHDKRSDEE